jgi:poly-gamma-glutamate synthesis protein (capsule biosynthesis protein)
MDWSMRGDRVAAAFGARLAAGLRRHRRLAAGGALLLAGAIGAALLLGSHGGRSAAAAVPYPHELAQVSFAVAGDVIPHEPVRAAATAAGDGAAGWGALFADVADVFEHADFGFVNLETPVAPAHSRGSKPFMFDAPVALLDALKANGIKIVSFANNHVMDQGWAGFAETREHLRERGLLFAGSGDTAQQGWQPVIVEANGIKVGWLGMALAQRQSQPRQGRAAARELFPLSG